MLFIDAVKEDYLKYLRLVEPLLSSKAVVVADNVKRFAEAVHPYLDYVRNSGNYESSYHEVGDDAVEVSVRLLT
jgi:predicted O-methyltransferase YrrM